MCHCAPVLTIQLRKHVGSRSACVQDVHRGCALPENDSGCAPTARLSAESSDIYSRSTPPSNFEIGSSPSRDLALASPPSPQQMAAGCAAPSPSRRVARSLLAGGGKPLGFRPGRRRPASRRGLAATSPFARG